MQFMNIAKFWLACISKWTCTNWKACVKYLNWLCVHFSLAVYIIIQSNWGHCFSGARRQHGCPVQSKPFSGIWQTRCMSGQLWPWRTCAGPHQPSPATQLLPTCHWNSVFPLQGTTVRTGWAKVAFKIMEMSLLKHLRMTSLEISGVHPP